MKKIKRLKEWKITFDIGCFLKKVLHKHEEKIQENVKMNLEIDENLVQPLQ